MKKTSIIVLLIGIIGGIMSTMALAEYQYTAPEKAKQELGKLLPQYDVNQKDTKLLQQIGLCYHSLGSTGDAESVIKAIDFFQKALDMEPSNNELKAWLGSATNMRARDAWMTDKMKYVSKGMALMNAAVTSEPENINIRLTRANSCLYMPSFLGKDNIAVSDFEFVAARLQGSEDKELLQEVYYKVGLAYKKMNNVNKAKENFNMAISINSASEMAKKIAKEEHL